MTISIVGVEREKRNKAIVDLVRVLGEVIRSKAQDEELGRKGRVMPARERDEARELLEYLRNAPTTHRADIVCTGPGTMCNPQPDFNFGDDLDLADDEPSPWVRKGEGPDEPKF